MTAAVPPPITTVVEVDPPATSRLPSRGQAVLADSDGSNRSYHLIQLSIAPDVLEHEGRLWRCVGVSGGVAQYNPYHTDLTLYRWDV